MANELVDDLEIKGGERLRVRPIRPDDADGLNELHARLSPDTIYRRYFGGRPFLSPADVRWLTDVHQEWRFALVAEHSTGALAGVARYEGDPASSDAEIALIVDDTWQGCGLGSGLLRRLIDVARVRRLPTLTAVVLAHNRPMLNLLWRLPVPVASVRDAETIVFTIQLADLDVPADRERLARAHLTRAADRRDPSRLP